MSASFAENPQKDAEKSNPAAAGLLFVNKHAIIKGCGIGQLLVAQSARLEESPNTGIGNDAER